MFNSESIPSEWSGFVKQDKKKKSLELLKYNEYAVKNL